MDIINLCGLVGATAFAISGVPQMIKSIKDGHAYGVAWGMIILWLIGEVAMIAYTLMKYTNDYILLGNYLINFMVISVIAFYKIFPRVKLCGSCPSSYPSEK
jgi:uncharacterized protein with PQ loop repeat